MAAYMVDMVHFTSPVMENNELMRRRAKSRFWEGIVVPYEQLSHYIEEDDAILIGPGMERGNETARIVNNLLSQYPHKKWIVDGGALQEVDPALLSETMIITPNKKEAMLLDSKLQNTNCKIPSVILAKGSTDTITAPSTDHPVQITLTGGSPGLTRGGTGDVLAGLTLGLYAKTSAYTSCIVASYCLKTASLELADKQGPFFSPTDLIHQIPKSLWSLVHNQVNPRLVVAPQS